MKVICWTDVKGQGKKDERKEVSAGYATNFLIPKKLAAEATTETLNQIKLKEKAKAAQLEKDKANAKEIAAKLQSVVVKISAKAGAGGKLFGSVTSKEISEALSKQCEISIDKNKIVQADPIKTFGSFEVKCKLGFEISGTINVVVAEEK